MSARQIDIFSPLGECMTTLDDALADSCKIVREIIDQFAPDYIVQMVSGGRDSACSYAVGKELGLKTDLIIHGNTRTGIRQTTEHVVDYYGSRGPDLAIADAGTAYEDYVLRKGFFGIGVSAHAYSYRVLKATPFRKVVSAKLRQRKRGVKVVLINGARKDESANRTANLPICRVDPAAPGNLWVNLVHHWSEDQRDAYLEERQVPINPVATQLCRSGECMCGTMQAAAERLEAAALYPEWGVWLDELEAEARRLFGFGWGEPFGSPPDPRQQDLFQPMCTNCTRRDGTVQPLLIGAGG